MKIKQILNIDDFDPLNVDVAFLDKVSAQIPDKGYMDPAMAEHLATATLKAADYCIDLLGQSTLYLAHCEAQKRSIKASVIKDLLDNKKPSTIVKEIFADNEDYQDISNKYNMALALHTWLENKHAALLKTHHLCKDFIRKSEGLQGMSGWEPSENASSNVESPIDKDRTVGKTSWNV